MIVKLLTEHHFEFLSLRAGGRGSSESTHVKMPHYWKSHVTAHFQRIFIMFRRHCSKFFNMCHLIDLKSFTLKPEKATSLEKCTE